MVDLNGLLETVERSRVNPIMLPARDAPNLEFSLDEYGLRYAAATGLMRQLNLDALVLVQPNTIRYMSGLQTWLWILPPLLPTAVIVMCPIVVSALAPCQWRSPALMCATSPTLISRCSCSVATMPEPEVTTSTWSQSWVCHPVVQPWLKFTTLQL